jgi:hypothetical protein
MRQRSKKGEEISGFGRSGYKRSGAEGVKVVNKEGVNVYTDVIN